MVTLVASPRGDPFCRPKIRCNMAKKGAKTLCFKISYKTPLNGRKNNPTFVDKFGFSDPKRNLLSWCFDSRTVVLFSFLPSYLSRNVTYRKIPKISPRSYIFQRPFLSGLFLDGLIFVTAYVRREVCVSKSIGLAYSWKEINRFCFVLLCIWGQFSKYKTPGGLYWEGRLHGGFFMLRVWAGAYTWRGLIFGILR